jgi:uncharacterized protein
MKLKVIALSVILLGYVQINIGHSASFDCTKSSAPVERMICADEKLGQLDEELALAYSAARAGEAKAYVDEVISKQRQWLKQRVDECKVAKQADVTDPEKIACMRRATENRLVSFGKWREHGKTIIHNPSPLAHEACSALLDRKNIKWLGRDRHELDSFRVQTAKHGRYPNWTKFSEIIDVAFFDFFNSGTKQTVYKIYESKRTYMYTLYIVVDSSEDLEIREKLHIATKNENEFIKMRDDIFELAREIDNKQGSRSYKSHVIDMSSQAESDASYIDLALIFFNNKSIIIAEPVYNLGKATASIYEPKPDGKLALLCSHKAIGSYAKRVTTAINPKIPCPVGVKKVDIPWENRNGKEFAIIDLQEWGGKRPVLELCIEANAICTYETFVGPVDAATVTDDYSSNWQPLRDASASGRSLLLTEIGPYVRLDQPYDEKNDSREDEVAYHRITKTGLVPACKERDDVIPPPGYGR